MAKPASRFQLAEGEFITAQLVEELGIDPDSVRTRYRTLIKAAREANVEPSIEALRLTPARIPTWVWKRRAQDLEEELQTAWDAAHVVSEPL